MSHVGYLVLQSILHLKKLAGIVIHSLFTRRQRYFSLQCIYFCSCDLTLSRTQYQNLYSCNNVMRVVVVLWIPQRDHTVRRLVPPPQPQIIGISNLCIEPSKTETTSHEFKRTFSVKKRNLMLLFHLFQFTRRITILWNLKRTESHSSPLFQTRKILLFLMKKFQLFQRKFLYSFISIISLCYY